MRYNGGVANESGRNKSNTNTLKTKFFIIL